MKVKLLLITIFLILIKAMAFAQGAPGGGDSSDCGPDPCPLDTWVLVLAGFALIFVTMRLYHKEKAGEIENRLN